MSFAALPLYWRVCVINGLMFLVAMVILVVVELRPCLNSGQPASRPMR